MQEKMTTRFSELRRAFRTLDEDASGSLDRDEFKQVLVMFNLGIPDRVCSRSLPLALCLSLSRPLLRKRRPPRLHASMHLYASVARMLDALCAHIATSSTPPYPLALLPSLPCFQGDEQAHRPRRL